MITDFDIKFDSLTPALKDYLRSDYQSVLSSNIRKKYHLSFGLSGFFDELISKIYFGEQALNLLTSEVKDRLKIDEAISAKIVADILGMKVLPAKEYLPKTLNIEEAIINLGAKPATYKIYTDIFKKAIAEEKAGTYLHEAYFNADQPSVRPTPAQVVEHKEDEVEVIGELDPEAKKLHLEKFFAESLDDLLSLEGSTILTEINDDLIDAMSADNSIAKSLADILSNNKTILSKENIVLEEKELPSSYANWLKDFFSVVGADSFDTLSIAKYIISSANAKKLSEEEQAKLRRFLTLYHNIHFFPTPFSAIPVDKWEIIPGARTTPTTVETKEPETKTPAIKQAIKQPKWSVPQPAAPVPMKDTTKPGPKSAELLELEKMRDQYAVGSLERSAIEEEIKHLT